MFSIKLVHKKLKKEKWLEYYFKDNKTILLTSNYDRKQVYLSVISLNDEISFLLEDENIINKYDIKIVKVDF